MRVTVSHQQPVELDPVHTISCADGYDPLRAVTESLINPILASTTGTTPVSVVDEGNQDITQQIGSIIMGCLGEAISPDDETLARQIFEQGLTHVTWDHTLPIASLFAVQAAGRNNLPAPSDRVLYLAGEDVGPAASALMTNPSKADLFFASVAYTYQPETLGFWFHDEATFTAFKAWLATTVNGLKSVLTAETISLFDNFQTLNLRGLTESIRLRRDDVDGNEEYSFARVLINLLMTYVKQQGRGPTVGVMPFNVAELFCPRTVVFANIESHSAAGHTKIDREWSIINQSLALPANVLSRTKIQKLTALQRAATRAQSMASRPLPGQPGSRSAAVAFRRQPPPAINLMADIVRALRRMGKVTKSHNTTRITRTSFAKANRRAPDDPNRPGKVTGTAYLPDIHIYLDTSGSISEDNYQQAVVMLIKLAKKLNVHLYFSSFSHVLSEETLLRVRNRSIRRIWQEFRRTPKVTGRTDYEQIWNHVAASRVRRRRLNLVITDFEWLPRSSVVEHPANIYYAPCASMDWDQIVDAARNFSESMTHIDPAIHQRLLGLIR